MYIKYLKKEKEKEIQQIQLLQLQSALKGTETIKEYIYIYILELLNIGQFIYSLNVTIITK